MTWTSDDNSVHLKDLHIVFSCVMMYIMCHAIGLPMVSLTIHMPTLFTIIKVPIETELARQ